MKNMTIIPYEADRDRRPLENMLGAYHYYCGMFKEAADGGQCIWVVYVKGHLAGALFHDGLQRGTEMTIFVEPA